MIKEYPFLKNLLISDDGNVFIPRSRDRYNNEPGYKEYHREYLRKWRKNHSIKQD